MTVYIAGRQTGKTIYLIRMSAKTGAVIVAPTYQMVSYIDQMARKLGLKIPPPISVVEWAQMVARKQVHSEQRYLVDELQMVLSQMNVEAATLNEDSKEEVHMFGVKETCCTDVAIGMCASIKRSIWRLSMLWTKSASICLPKMKTLPG